MRAAVDAYRIGLCANAALVAKAQIAFLIAVFMQAT